MSVNIQALRRRRQNNDVGKSEHRTRVGAARHLQSTFRADITIIARPAAAAPAVGYKVRHDAEQAEVLRGVFG